MVTSMVRSRRLTVSATDPRQRDSQLHTPILRIEGPSKRCQLDLLHVHITRRAYQASETGYRLHGRLQRTLFRFETRG
jgi:hypothetical protein